MRAGCAMSRVSRPEEPVLAAPGRDVAVTAVVLALTAVVFALVADHGVLAHIQRADDAWLHAIGAQLEAGLAAVQAATGWLNERRGHAQVEPVVGEKTALAAP